MKVRCIRYTTENDNTNRVSTTGVRIGQWYDVLDTKTGEVGNVKFSDPTRYLIDTGTLKIYPEKGMETKYWLSAYLFETIREVNLSQLIHNQP